jgi:hypothetical protein
MTRSFWHSLGIALVVALIVTVVGVSAVRVLLATAFTLVDEQGTALKTLRQEFVEAKEERSAAFKIVEQACIEPAPGMESFCKRALAEIQVPPNNDKLFTILSKGVGVVETEVRTDTATTTEEAAFTTDLGATLRTDAVTQEVFIQNIGVGTQGLCYADIAWTVAGADCVTKCSTGSIITCSGAATDGIRLAAGQSVARRYDGTVCLCVVGSAVGGVAYQTERVVR